MCAADSLESVLGSEKRRIGEKEEFNCDTKQERCQPIQWEVLELGGLFRVAPIEQEAQPFVPLPQITIGYGPTTRRGHNVK